MYRVEGKAESWRDGQKPGDLGPPRNSAFEPRTVRCMHREPHLYTNQDRVMRV